MPSDLDPLLPAYYVATGPGRYRSTLHAQGAWAPEHQHMGPISGLLIHELQRCAPRPDLLLSRVSFDILGVISMGDVEITAEVTRPGRTVELVEASLAAGGRVAVRARGWRLAASDTSALAAVEVPVMPGPDEAKPWDGTQTWPGGFIASLEVRRLPGWRPGRGRVWLRPRVSLVDGAADVPGLAQVFSVIDTMNGVAVRCDPRDVLFPNTDLTVHLFRQPSPGWLGLDVSVTFGAAGIGMTSAALHDEHGPFGRALQILTVRPLGAPS